MNPKNLSELSEHKREETKLQELQQTGRTELAVEYFMSGYNCSQSIFAAYCDLFGISAEQGLLIAAGLGAGVGRMREVCGAITGSAMILGLKYGSQNPADTAAKTEMYKNIQKFANEFKDIHSTVICRELLGNVSASKGSMPDKRTMEYYEKRPCAQIVKDAAVILEKYIL